MKSKVTLLNRFLPPRGTSPLEAGFKFRVEDVRRMLYRLRKNALSMAGLIIVLSLMTMAIAADRVAPYPEDAEAVHFDRTYWPPSGDHLFGTDEVGRDVLSRVVLGSRISLSLGFSVLAIAIGIGVPLGLVAGYMGGKIDAVITGITDVFLTIPPMALALAVSAVLAPTLQNCIIAISFGWWPWYTRLIRGQVLSLKEESFVEASRAIGAGSLYIAFKEILPNCIAIIIVKATLDFGYAILTGATLGFLGLGVRPPTPEWGTMISHGRIYLPYMWWLTAFPGLAIAVTVLGFNLLGDGLRDVFDVRIE